MKLTHFAAIGLQLWITVAHESHSYEWKHRCPQLGPLNPKSSKALADMDQYLNSEEFLNISVARLSGAVQIDTTSQNSWRDFPGEDPVWKPMSTFRKYLEETFPLIHRHLKLERINKHGLVYTWEGRNQSLKPTLFLAHQDVVPAPNETIRGEWTRGPFSGDSDGKYIWGRGSIDCKTTLIASMSAVESLLEVRYAPQRTLILAFGFDEEIGGFQGARRIAEHLLNRYKKDGIALLIDEGPGFFHDKEFATIYAVPGLAEKGAFNANISVHMESGHIAFSTRDNSITIMADLITKLHAEHPMSGPIQKYDPFLETLFCLGQHVAGFREKYIDALERIDLNETAVNDFLPRIIDERPALRPLVESTHSLAMIQGGNKINVIPEQTVLSINHRLHLGTSVEQAKSHLEQIVKAYIAGKNADKDGTNLTFRGWADEDSVNSIKLTAFQGSLEQSPVTPFSVSGITPYGILQGTIQSLYKDSNLTLVTPIVMPANTDSRHYWNLTQHIFRFSPGHDMADAQDNQISSNAHNNNERASIIGHVNGVKWYSLFIRNMDETDLA
ncbi:hypothetical protein J7T55_010049 [Diaporthe amygdali]|uniref:uncharacterized protein n=1 Tax=Phomopsis amygdali TaxID=1214568 RepID=UPI0022FE63AE|nr:uncharacterized protein J7T55_010049 [Diaporthe amygdali]KAJ0113805.1 hypothetical protein J7T55_010049 [Diaporthe amygdali]